MAKKLQPKENSSQRDLDFLDNLELYIKNGVGTNVEKFENFAKYVPREDITIFLTRYEIFKKVLNVQGSIIECGVFFGGGLMTYAKLSAIFEPVNNQRKIIGFDTFSGFPSLAKQDSGATSRYAHKGGLDPKVDTYGDLKKSIELFDSNRFVNHIPKVELVKGDASITIPKYVKDNPQLVVSLLYLDFDLYKPTKIAIETLVPRMPKGAIIAFDELNAKLWPGETRAVLDSIGIRNLKIERFAFGSYMSYAVLD